ncbi:MAG TPA: hypothetical protein DCO68_11940 [Methylophilaceae bacterium]|nr:hypothetical protein [Methylophilaceae bacterium]HAJ72776.1 hypothetical protein [Methylophilaceae bacterium]
MIHVVEINEQNRARVWFAFDEADFVRKVQANFGETTENIIFEQTTPQQLLHSKHASAEIISALVAQFGADTIVYRADYLLGHGVYQVESVSALRASLAAVASVADFRVYTSDEDAAEELDRDPLYKSKEGFEAALKLRAQLVEMEVIAEDF